MENTTKKSVLGYWVILVVFYLIMLLWWVEMRTHVFVNTNQNYVFGLMEGVLPLVGGIIGFIKSKRWSFSSMVGKSVFFLSAGLVSWGIGSIIFAYYNLFLNVAVPYPSLADVAYIVSWPLWAIGMIYVLKTLGIKYRIKQVQSKLFLFIVPIVCIAISYYLLFILARGGGVDLTEAPLKAFFDLAYPVGDIVILTMTTLVYGISLNYLGGVFRTPILIIIFGFALNYLSDFSFSYTTTNGSFYVANWVDLLFTTTMFVLSLGVCLFDPILLEIANSRQDLNKKPQ